MKTNFRKLNILLIYKQVYKLLLKTIMFNKVHFKVNKNSMYQEPNNRENL